MSARHKRHECITNDASATRVRHERHECNTSTTRVLHERHDCNTSEQFHSKNYLLKMPHSHAKMRLKSAPQKLNFVMAKAISNSYTLDSSCKCPWTFPYSYA